MLNPVPLPWMLGGGLALLLLTSGTVGWLAYSRGVDDAVAAQNVQKIAGLEKRIKDGEAQQAKRQKAEEEFQSEKPQIRDRIIERTREIQVPPDADPYMPVWFVRLWDRLATGDRTSDPYPGELPSAPSDVRLSEVRVRLEAWVEKYESAGLQIDSTRGLNPVLPREEKTEPTFLERINPFD